MAKFDWDKRTFETRLLFIKELFTNTYSQTAIMSHCIQYKLDKSFQQYVKEINESVWNLDGEDPIKVLKKID